MGKDEEAAALLKDLTLETQAGLDTASNTASTVSLLTQIRDGNNMGQVAADLSSPAMSGPFEVTNTPIVGEWAGDPSIPEVTGGGTGIPKKKVWGSPRDADGNIIPDKDASWSPSDLEGDDAPTMMPERVVEGVPKARIRPKDFNKGLKAPAKGPSASDGRGCPRRGRHKETKETRQSGQGWYAQW